MNTLLEIYDTERPINNMLGAWYLQPKKIVYFYHESIDEQESRKQLSQMFNSIGLKTNVVFAKLDRMDVNDMADWVEENRVLLGDYALELTGGDDVLLFMAGCSYERFTFPLYARYPDGRFIALPSGEQIHDTGASFTVEQRLALCDGNLQRQGRLTDTMLEERFLSLAVRMFDLQKQNSRQWTQQTQCIQQCVADEPDDSLSIIIDTEKCLEHGFSPQRGHQLKRLLTAGALSALDICDSGIRMTFLNAIVRDCLCDFGIWLELYIYSAIKDSGEFDDQRLSSIVQWSDESVVNEIDITATAGLGLLIVSCKTCDPSMTAVAELNVLSDRFGVEYTHSLLICLPKAQTRLDGIRARCEEMDIMLMDIRQYDRNMLVSYFRRLGRKVRAARLS